MIRHPAVRFLALAAALFALSAPTRPEAGGLASITGQDLHRWLDYVASDELEGRAIFSSGLGLAAAYIEDHLHEWGAAPAGDAGSYLQTVRILGVNATSRSTLTVEVGGRTRTFRDGEGVTFPKDVGGRRQFTVDRVEFAGYGLDAPQGGHDDFRGAETKGTAVVWLGAEGPGGLDGRFRRLVRGRGRHATEQLGAAASIGPVLPARSQPQTPAADGRPRPDFTTSQRLDHVVAPTVSADDDFFEFLFSRSPTSYAELKRLASAQQPLPRFTLDGVRLTFDLDAEYQVVRTRLSHNVVAVVEGRDPALKDTYVAFGAHYDHLGYAQGAVVLQGGSRRLADAPGPVKDGNVEDRIWNGADDDGSGTVALMALARAFALGPRPRRSLLFVWHTGEEEGLFGSRYFADHPTVPLDRVVAQLNIDMIGRNRDDDPAEANTVYVVGSDRISTELDRIDRAADAALPAPLTLDYRFNDPADLEQLYYRSDHYSYAAKGIPIIFFTTGLHPDYHTNADEVSRIQFDKMTRIVRLVYETARRVADLDHAPVRDERGARAGRATAGDGMH